MKKLHAVGVGILMLNIATSASAAVTYVDGSGNTVTPSLIDASKDAVYFSEAIIGATGQYTVTNNTTDSFLVGFGISNFGTIAYIGNIGSTFGCESGLMNSWCYESSNLDASNWGTATLNFEEGLTGQDIFGDISNVLDPGDNTLNYYSGADGELGHGDTWDQFLFGPAVLSSQLFAILSGPSGAIYASGGQPINAVPVPAAVWLFGSGLLGLVGLARRKTA